MCWIVFGNPSRETSVKTQKWTFSYKSWNTFIKCLKIKFYKIDFLYTYNDSFLSELTLFDNIGHWFYLYYITFRFFSVYILYGFFCLIIVDGNLYHAKYFSIFIPFAPISMQIQFDSIRWEQFENWHSPRGFWTELLN